MRRPERYKRALPAMNAIIIPGSSVRTYWSCWITACFRAQSQRAENSVGADLCVDSKCIRWSATREHRSIEHGLQASVTNPRQTRLEWLQRRPHGDGYTDQLASELLVFSHELFNPAYDALEFIDEI